MRIFPMTLRVSGYSKPPDPDPLYEPSSRELESLVWKLPVIHVVGESTGSDIDADVVRQVGGTVRMIGDGAVRWSLVKKLTLATVDIIHFSIPDFKLSWREYT